MERYKKLVVGINNDVQSNAPTLEFITTLYGRLFDITTELSRYHADVEKVSLPLVRRISKLLERNSEYAWTKLPHDFNSINDSFISWPILAIEIFDNSQTSDIDIEYMYQSLDLILISYQSFLRKCLFLLERNQTNILC